MVKKSVSNYFNVQVKTAGAGQRVVMMYEGIVKNLKLAQLLMNENKGPLNIEKINNHLQLAERLILELKLALDMERGGEISQNLNNLYEFWIAHISEANVEKDPAKIQEVLSMADELRETWVKAAKEARKMGIS